MEWIIGSFVFLCISAAVYLAAKPILDSYFEIYKKRFEDDDEKKIG